MAKGEQIQQRTPNCHSEPAPASPPVTGVHQSAPIAAARHALSVGALRVSRGLRGRDRSSQDDRPDDAPAASDTCARIP